MLVQLGIVPQLIIVRLAFVQLVVEALDFLLNGAPTAEGAWVVALSRSFREQRFTNRRIGRLMLCDAIPQGYHFF